MTGHPGCSCIEGNFNYTDFNEKYLGMDDIFGELKILQCKRCGRRWLRYYYVNEAFSRSGRWYCGLISPETAQTVSKGNALAMFGEMDWYFFGGSFYDGIVSKGSGPITLYP